MNSNDTLLKITAYSVLIFFISVLVTVHIPGATKSTPGAVDYVRGKPTTTADTTSNRTGSPYLHMYY